MRTRPKKNAALPALPRSHLELIHAKGFEVLSYQNVAINVLNSLDEKRSEWLPFHMVNWEKKLFVQWSESDKYSFFGWEPQRGHSHGGRYETVAGALGWFDWLERQK